MSRRSSGGLRQAQKTALRKRNIAALLNKKIDDLPANGQWLAVKNSPPGSDLVVAQHVGDGGVIYWNGYRKGKPRHLTPAWTKNWTLTSPPSDFSGWPEEPKPKPSQKPQSDQAHVAAVQTAEQPDVTPKVVNKLAELISALSVEVKLLREDNKLQREDNKLLREDIQVLRAIWKA